MKTEPTKPTLIESTINRATRWWPYVWPTVLLPLACIYAIEFVKLLLFIAQIAIMFATAIATIDVVFGLWCGIMNKYNPTHVHGSFLKINLTKAIPTVKWGFDFAHWALEEKE